MDCVLFGFYLFLCVLQVHSLPQNLQSLGEDPHGPGHPQSQRIELLFLVSLTLGRETGQAHLSCPGGKQQEMNSVGRGRLEN